MLHINLTSSIFHVYIASFCARLILLDFLVISREHMES